jgi:general secretion pathway protein L
MDSGTLLGLGTLLRHWIDVLAATCLAQYGAWRSRRSLLISFENSQFFVRKAPADSDRIIAPEHPDDAAQSSALAVIRAGERASTEVLQLANRGFVILECPSENVAVRRLAVPVQAREFVAGIVSNQIERLSPWHADQAIYGFDAYVAADDPATLEVRVLIASRTIVESIRDQLTASGLSVDRIVASLRDIDRTKVVTLWSRMVDVSCEQQTRMRRHVGISIASVVAASLCLSVWATISAQFIRGASQDLAVRTDTLRRHMQAPSALRSAASLPENERVWYEKETSASAALVLEALSRALPKTAYLTELSLQGTTLRIAGLTADAPPLIGLLEHCGYLTDLRFFAPTTRGPDGTHFLFHIEGRVDPHGRLAEDRE